MLVPDHVIYSGVKLAIFYAIYQFLSLLIPFLRMVFHYKKFPSEKGHWLFGDLLKIAPGLPKVDRDMIGNSSREFAIRFWLKNDRRSDLSVIWFGWMPLVVCSSHHSLKQMTQELHRHKATRFLGLRDGLVCSSGPKWKERRRVLEPLFTSKQLSLITPTMNLAVIEQINSLDMKLDQPIVLSSYIDWSTTNVIFMMLFKVSPNAGKDLKERIIEIMKIFNDTATTRFGNPLYWNDWLFSKFQLGKYMDKLDKEIDDNIKYVLDMRMNTSYFPESKRPMMDDKYLNINNGIAFTDHPHIDLIDLMIKIKTDAKHTMDLEGMIEETITLVAAGHKTISISLGWTIFALGNHPKMQERAVQEINEVIANDEDLNDVNKLNQLIYLEQCINESLRLFPPVHYTLKSLQNDVTIGSKVLLKGSTVIEFILAAHHDATVYQDPFKFNPDRFSPDVVDSIPKCAFMPFGGGQRRCLGYRYAMLEMKIFLARFLRRYQVKSVKSMEEVLYFVEYLARPTDPLEVIIKLRE